jgi:hypothetical protein
MERPTRVLPPSLARIAARAREFDIGPLLRVLERNGFGREEVLYESNPEPVASGALIERVTFYGEPARSVTLTLNIGLLGPDALLPSYFLEIAEQAREPEALFDFLRFFDHRLIENALLALHPEMNPAMFADWDRTKGFYLKMIGLGSTSTLQWLFQLYFPELRAGVTRRPFRNSSTIHALRTGESKLDGTAVLGRVYESSAAGLRVELYAQEETDELGRAWPHVVRERLGETLLPLLAPFRLPLLVSLTVLVHQSWSRLTPAGYLGYERVRGEAESGHRIVIYEGNTGDPAPVRYYPPLHTLRGSSEQSGSAADLR